jgi:mycofactocin system FadH/OYE family oxidoreductase 1
MNLLEPLIVRGHTLSSRVMFGPIETNLGRGREFSPDHVAFYARRAAGGAGIVVTEIASVHDSDWPYERAPLATVCGPGWHSIADAVHAASPSCVVLAGLGHSGGQGTSHWSQGVLWAPSPVPEVATREVPKIMEQRDIDAVVEGFVSAARLAVASGLDGVEINIGQYSLLRQFISGLTNMRSDDYGQDRLKFARDVLTAVRSAIGERVLAIRLSCDELAPWAGVTPEAAVDVAVALVACGVDLVTVVRGSIYSSALTQPDMHVEPGFNIGLARQIRDGLRAAGSPVAVVAQGSIVEWGQAEWAIGDGVCDAVEMTRAQLADADLVAKVRAESFDAIRPCILCNQTCKVRDNRNPIITCVMDPRTGHELVDAAEPIAASAAGSRGNLTVLGAGVAGMEAARIAALAGWRVTIRERSDRAGGVIRVAAIGAGRHRLALAADWLESQCRSLGVQFEFGGSADATTSGPTIVATGGVSGTLPFVVEPGAVVLHDVEVFGGAPLPEGPIVVWDPIGGPIAISMAEWLADAGRTVTLVTPDLLVGEKLALSGDLAPSQSRLHGRGITLQKRALLRRVSTESVTVEDRFSAASSTIPVAAVVACGQRLPDTSVDPEELLPQIGDRVAPRTILEAVLEGRRAAFALR